MADTRFSDIVIVGGAAVGAAVGWHAGRLLGKGTGITVIERDPTYSRASTTLSAASIRQQFSTPENIALSRYGLTVLREMAADTAGPDPAFVEGGYLVLAPAGGGDLLARIQAVQAANGADNILLDAPGLASRFPWLRLDGLEAGCLGLSGEGWFDAQSYLNGLRKEAVAAGARFLHGEVTGVITCSGAVTDVILADGSRVACGTLVNAGGPSAGGIAAMAGRELPVEPRKRTVFVVDCPDAPKDMPLIADPSGFWLRREGAVFITGRSPPEAEDGPCAPDDFDPDHESFQDCLWPLLAERIPAFGTLKVMNAWAGHYDYNALDQNAIVGPDEALANLIYANGFSGHGLQHAPGVGRAVAEWIAFGEYRTIDLARFGYGRITANEPLYETNVI